MVIQSIRNFSCVHAVFALLILYSLTARCVSGRRLRPRGHSSARLRHPALNSNLQDAQPLDPNDRSTAALKASQSNLKAYLELHTPTVPLLSRTKSNRGIVITAGGQRLLINAAVVVKVIREALGSNLPIEVFYYGESEYDTQLVATLEAVPGVTVLDGTLSALPKYLQPGPQQLHGYAKKVFSLFSCSFEEVLLLDADSQPLRQPETLFELPAYKRHGNLFWRDYWTANTALEAPREEAYQLLGLVPPWQGREREWACTESGQLLYNKRRHSASLIWTLWINLWADIFYKLVLGDKDTFEMGFMLSGNHRAFHQMPNPPRAAFTQAIQDGWHLHVGMVHSIDGIPAFLHRTSGGKFDGGKEAAQQLRADYITEMMSVSMAKQYTWHISMAINVLAHNKAEVHLVCSDLEPATYKALQRVYASGKFAADARNTLESLSACQNLARSGSSIPLLPLQVFGQSIERAVTFSYKTFEALKAT